MARPLQFNWRRHWSKRVAPHLDNEIVQASLDMGMSMLVPDWRRGDAPCHVGAIPSDGGRVIEGRLSWYQPWGRCHWIAFFSMSIGVLNYPDLDWRFVSGTLHTVPVGYTPAGVPEVVMDILLFAGKSADESIALATKEVPNAPPAEGWAEGHQAYIDLVVPALRRDALQKCAAQAPKHPAKRLPRHGASVLA